MSSIDIVSMSVRNMFKRKLRTFLTILGVIVGTAAIVVMISLGLAMNRTFEQEIEKMEDITTITIYNPSGGMYRGDMAVSSSASRKPKEVLLDDNAIVSFKQIPGVLGVSPLDELYLYFKSGRYVMSVSVYGIDPTAMEALGYVVEEGRLLDPTDKYAMVFGSKAEYLFYNSSKGWSDRYNKAYMGEEVEHLVNLFRDRIGFTYDWEYIYPSSNSEGEEKIIKPYDGKTVGILADKSYSADRSVFMNITTVQKLKEDQRKFEQSRMQEYGMFSSQRNNQQQQKSYNTVYAKCSDLDTVRNVKEKIEEMGYYCEIPSSQLDGMQQMAGSLQALLGAIGAVSLFVAAIGIANTMIMAIYERTREIGVMKVIGAAISDIKKLFLLEAALIGFIGGLFGLMVSFGISHILNTTGVSFMGTISQYMEQTQVSLITPWLCAMAMVFSTLVGLISGYFPAKRAMNLSALSAIRTE